MLRSVNRTQIVLIPKVQTPTKVSQFCPISLCTISYKIIAKVLANQLKPFLPSIVSENQSAFVGGCQVTDNVLIAHELTHYIKHKHFGTQGVAAFKLDMAKAYDRIEYSYLEMVMTQLDQDCEALSQILGSMKLPPVKRRYFPHTSFRHAKASNTTSWAWKNIVWARELIDKGWRWQVRSGKEIHVWEDPWLSKNTNFRIDRTTSRREGIKRVADLIDSDTKSWKVSLIRETFNHEDADAILSIPISYTSQQNRKIWHPSRNGTFSVKTAYHLAKEGLSSRCDLQAGQTSSSNVLPTIWKKLWGLSIHPKVKMFI
ncbi:hypothetical protein RHSIM_Rhsim05G0208700 [Rhododendron simsii]|uniref:Reverse transcriptase domain-containing protein n=1 Tax=Rhododendron simsii TaxID=118357 RepID=A0A834LMD2_RHOSS|nr:hypothetical protein RHSIM_Rhsim05G0208700 [Rhododendron simsii]